MRLQSLFSQVAVYGLSSVAGRIFQFLLTPLYTYYFLPEDFGIISEFYAWAGFLAILLSFSLESFIFKQCNSLDAQGQKVFVVQAISFLSVINFVFLLLVAGASGFISQKMGYEEGQIWVILFALILSIDGISSVLQTQLRLEQKAMRFASINLSMILCNVVLNILFLLVFKPFLFPAHSGVTYVFWANLLASLLRLFLLLPQLRAFSFVLSLDWLRAMLPYCLPLVWVGLGGMVNELLDRLLLKYLLMPTLGEVEALRQLGIYSAVYKFSIIITLCVQAFRYATEPFYFKTAQDRASKQARAKVLHLYLSFLIFVLLATTLFLPELKRFFLVQPAYWEGLHIVPMLLLAQLLLGVYYQQSVWYRLSGKTWLGALLTSLGVFITVLANFLLIPKLGYEGAAYATLTCYGALLLFSIVLEYILQKNFAFSWHAPLLFVIAFLVYHLQKTFSVFAEHPGGLWILRFASLGLWTLAFWALNEQYKKQYEHLHD
jgi:O-antigen/teichoic acid export membrane protein